MTKSSNIKIVIILCLANVLNVLNEVNGKDPDDVYEIGCGIADITGPVVDVNMMGYGKTGQDAQGIHFRLFSRAFIIIDNKGKRIVYINCDLGMISTLVKLEVIKGLKKNYGDVYREDNVALASTHTHSGPGGFLQYVLYIVSSQGFNRQNFHIIVSGIIRSIQRAHNSIKKGYIYYNEGKLSSANINRSPTSYLANPKWEQKLYKHNTDETMQILKFVTIDNQPLGIISWFPVHCTSMNNTNKLVSGDNKGYASMLFEQYMNPNYLPGKGNFVAAFSNANEGDVSPNTKGPRCIDTGFTCELSTSSCPDVKSSNFFTRQGDSEIPLSNEKCIASGPGKDMFESTEIIGKMQFTKAVQLFETAKTKITGAIRYVHKYVDMSEQNILNAKGEIVGKTCSPAMGYSFAAGTTDGPGAFDFIQGTKFPTPFWNLVRDFIRRPTKNLIKCHAPKPILLATGEMKFPYAWQPSIVPLQLISIGNFNSEKKGSITIVSLPGEFTTMSGRRLRTLLLKIINNVDSYKSYYDNLKLLNKKKVNLIENVALDLNGNQNLFRHRMSLNTMRKLYMQDNLPDSVINDNNANKLIQITDNNSIPPVSQIKPLDINIPISKNQSNETLELNNDIESNGYLNVNRIILSGLSNAYSSYVTTFEEYHEQRYEAASTIFGPYTLQAYLQQYADLVFKLLDSNLNQTNFDQVQPPYLLSKQIQLKPGVVYDGIKFNSKFGDLILNAKPIYKKTDTVKVIFRSGHPQNYNSNERTYLTVEKLDEPSKKWKIIATDANWETKFIWQRTGLIFGESQCTILWKIPSNTQIGIYRIRHFGASKSLFQTITSYEGSTFPFKVVD